MKPRVFVPAVVSGVLLWAAFFPLNLGPVAFVALVPWLTLVRAPVTSRRRYLAAYTGGFTFFLVALNWVRVAHPMMYLSWAGLALLYPVTWVMALWLVRRLDRLGVSLAVSVPVAWVALEYGRAHFPTGFPVLAHVGLFQMVGFGWYFLGYSQHEFTALIQVADLGGVYAVSFLVAAVNGIVAEWVLRSPGVRRWLRWGSEPPRFTRKRLAVTSGVVATLVAAAVGYGAMRLDHPAFAPGPHVAAIQGSVFQDEKDHDGRSLGKIYCDLADRAYLATPRPDLIVWPETCCPVEWFEASSKDVPDDFRKLVDHSHRELLRQRWATSTLFGLNGNEWEAGREWRYNSAVEVSANGEYLGRYDKMHLVPFGEYVPLRETFPWMNTFTPYDWDYSCRPGTRWTRFPLTTADGRAFTFGCLICYEDSDPYLARQYAGPTEPVDFLVNISNDGWFKGTEEHEQHLAICRFRAVEARRSIVRAVNMGISAVIDPDGRVIALPGDSWAASKKVEAVVAATVPVDARVSWFARLGDWLPAACWGLLLVGVVVGRLWLRRGPTPVRTV